MSLISSIQRGPVAVAARISNPLEERGLNPQPLPPKEGSRRGSRLASRLDSVALNPQPLPPRQLAAFRLWFR
ncbi:MAG: hypothetical protein IPK72_05575 [Candidatus Eisenbacteria bacterium]|nr:hypothetical protein [Candidatus Eisenbacteria bacterium]